MRTIKGESTVRSTFVKREMSHDDKVDGCRPSP